MMPAEQFVLIDLPLGAYMARIDTDTFQLVIQEISFFGFELRPIIHVRVTHTAYPRPAVQLEAIEFSFDGSDIVKSFSDICEVKGKTVFTWVEGGECVSGCSPCACLVIPQLRLPSLMLDFPR